MRFQLARCFVLCVGFAVVLLRLYSWVSGFYGGTLHGDVGRYRVDETFWVRTTQHLHKGAKSHRHAAGLYGMFTGLLKKA